MLEGWSVIDSTALDDINAEVIEYLRREKIQDPEYYSCIAVKGVKPNDIIKLINKADITTRWGRDYTIRVNAAIDYIYDECIIPYKGYTIEKQTEEDRILAKIIRNRGNMMFYDDELSERVSLNHVIGYLERSELLLNWNHRFIERTKIQVDQIKEMLLGNSAHDSN